MDELTAQFQIAWVAAFAILGHGAIFIYGINRIHSTGLHHHLVKAIDVVWYFGLFLIPLATLAYLSHFGPKTVLQTLRTLRPTEWFATYIAVSIVAAPICLIRWLIRKWTMQDTKLLKAHETQVIDAVQRLGRQPIASRRSWIAANLPLNQVFQIAATEKTIHMPALDPRLDGLRITHLSDLHFTGRITEDFYALAVELANEWPADLVVISGDIIDKRPCFDWLSRVLGRLESRVATCFVLGNHDLRIHNESGLRDELTGLGMLDLGKRARRLIINESEVLLAGNELPWFRPAADLAAEPPADFRIAVCHSPDQIGWARRHRMDLMLAGHTHGGQIRFPVIGPVFSPSRYGVRYSAGTFFEPPTLLHVSRGLSGTRPLRFNCQPELARLILFRNPPTTIGEHS